MKNYFQILCYVAVGVFIYFIVTHLTSDPSIFVNKEALIVICGGLVLSALVSFPMLALRNCGHALKKIMLDPPSAPTGDAKEIFQLSILAQKGIQRLEAEAENINHPFLKEVIDLALDGMSKEALADIMEKRMSERRETLSMDANIMLTLSKYSPALGLGATVLGLVELLTKLKNADMGEMGLGMAVALSATFYGIMIANLLFAPLSELLLSAGETDNKTREMIADGIICILEKKHPLVVGETVNSYLPIKDRIDFSAELASSGQRGSAGAEARAA